MRAFSQWSSRKCTKRHENRKILEALNEVYSDAPDPSEEALREGMRRHHRQLVEERGTALNQDFKESIR